MWNGCITTLHTNQASDQASYPEAYPGADPGADPEAYPGADPEAYTCADPRADPEIRAARATRAVCRVPRLAGDLGRWVGFVRKLCPGQRQSRLLRQRLGREDNSF